MAIALILPDDFEIETYAGLQAYLTGHLQLDQDTVDSLPDFIRLAEYRLNRLVLAPERETADTLTTTAASQTVSLPSDFRQMKQLKIEGDPSYPLAQVTLNVVEEMDYQGKPQTFAIANQQLYLGPVPDDAYSLRISYMQKLSALSSDSPKNWLLTNHADAYIYMTAAVVEQHLGNLQNGALYNQLAEAVIEEINEQGNRYRFSGPMRLRSPVVV